ncbi:HHR165Wp [Eremothecium sinecaudum]|uniref:HHR165Wp n=1 Tax=Eremothecium sinecaudum TaxID=45286 RepID=A0A0X8HWR8_9SACH|nr:HHR165Wp [Eremothecium sinecaudum]AMD22934.1 HHR165Wp [Eremothecium sinecaudum]
MATEEEISARHRKERKDLQNQITSLKKQASKKTRKQVNLKCEELTKDLEQRHLSELKSFRVEHGLEDKEESDNEDISPEQLLEELSLKQTIDETPKPPAEERETVPKRSNRQKARLAKRDAEIARIKEEARAEAALQPDLKRMEQDTLNKICQMNGLVQYDIRPDGHCLFASILDQLRVRHGYESPKPYVFPATYRGPQSLQEMNVPSLRQISCSYVREHRDDFIPYLFDEETMSIKDLDEYTEKMETTAQWGGEIEILALSKVFQCCISVMMSGRSVHKVNEDEITNPELKLVYYKHSYSLGEHYNSLHDL